MDEVDIGPAVPAVFTRLQEDDWGRPVAAFVSSDGDSFCLGRGELELRIRYLANHGEETAQERRALEALRAAGS